MSSLGDRIEVARGMGEAQRERGLETPDYEEFFSLFGFRKSRGDRVELARAFRLGFWGEDFWSISRETTREDGR
jgi:hypothetical protein